MKEIIFVGKDNTDSSILKRITNSSKFKVKKVRNLKNAEKIMSNIDPDVLLCAGKIKIDEDGEYFLDLD